MHFEFIYIYSLIRKIETYKVVITNPNYCISILTIAYFLQFQQEILKHTYTYIYTQNLLTNNNTYGPQSIFTDATLVVDVTSSTGKTITRYR